MSNKNFTLTYDELLLLLKEAYRTGYATYEMTAAGLEPYDDDGYARWVLLGMENNKQRKEIIKKWEESGLLDGLTEMDKDHPMLKVLEANGKQRINERWVAVTDALPKIASENYLVVKNGIVSISLFRGDWNEFQCDLNDFQKVTHWSECPKPPCL